MGNCLCHHHSSPHLVAPAPAHQTPAETDQNFTTCDDTTSLGAMEDELEGNLKSSSINTASSRKNEVKIKLTKKQLEELLSIADVKELTVQQILVHLMNGSDDDDHQNQRSWTPALQTIPE